MNIETLTCHIMQHSHSALVAFLGSEHNGCSYPCLFPQVVFGVESKDLIPLEDFTVDVAVCLDSWVGMVRQMKSKVTVSKFLAFNSPTSQNINRNRTVLGYFAN